MYSVKHSEVEGYDWILNGIGAHLLNFRIKYDATTLDGGLLGDFC